MKNDPVHDEAYKQMLVEKALNGINPIDPMKFESNSPYAEKKDKPIQPMTFEAPDKSFEDKLYILLLVGENNDSLFDGNFKICTGRTECYRHIQTLIEAFGEDIDVHESRVITETKQTETDTGNTKYYLINYTESLSVYAFCKSVESYYSNDTFSIDNYFDPPKSGQIKSTFEDVSAPYATMDDPIMAKVVSDSIAERNQRLRDMIKSPDTFSINHKTVDAKVEFPMLFDDDNGVNV